MSYADLGSQWLRQTAYNDIFTGPPNVPGAIFGAYGGPPCHTGASYEDCRPGFAVGFTLPKAINDKIRAMDPSVTALDGDFARNVAPNAPVRQSWNDFVVRWRDFVKKTFDNKLFNFIGTDEAAAAVNDFARQLDTFFDNYQRQLTPEGNPVPPPSGPRGPSLIPGRGGAPGDAPRDKPPSTSLFDLIPWWGWTLGVGVLGALGYSFYRAAQHAKAREEYLFKNVVPALVPHVPSSPDVRDASP